MFLTEPEDTGIRSMRCCNVMAIILPFSNAVLSLIIIGGILGITVSSACLFVCIIPALYKGSRRGASALTFGIGLSGLDVLAYGFARTSSVAKINNHRRRDLVSTRRIQRKYPRVIPNDGDWLDVYLEGLSRILSLRAKGRDGNATLFRIRKWLRECELNHCGQAGEPCCEPYGGSTSGHPDWLIDIEQRCLVAFRTGMQYMALSYVWGSVQSATTTCTNVNRMCQVGALIGAEAVEELPATVRDAMFLTGFLGHRYLWCDRLCIVQDDAMSKHRQIAQMAYIYARAHCTIIAYDNEHADDGLGGIPNLSGRLFSSSASDASQPRARGIWEKRAWTFQEQRFSVRQILMTAKDIRYDCCVSRTRLQAREQREDLFAMPASIVDYRQSTQIGGLVIPKKPSFTLYSELVQKYNDRQVNDQHPEDILNAFASLQLVLSDTLQCPVIQGIPEVFFSSSLLWTKYRKHRRPRRIFVDPVTGQKPASWSWMSVPGKIDFDRFSGRNRNTSCTSMVSWGVSTTPRSQRYRFQNHAAEAWKTHQQYIPTEVNTEHGPVDFASVQPSADGKEQDPRQLPTGEMSCDTAEDMSAKFSCNFLHGRVLMARFQTGTIWPVAPLTEDVDTVVSEISGDFAGILVSCDEATPRDRILTFIAVSQGFYSNVRHRKKAACCEHHQKARPIPEWYVDPIATLGCPMERAGKFSGPEMNEELDGYEFYDALWIEFDGDMAYRRGLARISKDAWDREVLGWIDVTLG